MYRSTITVYPTFLFRKSSIKFHQNILLTTIQIFDYLFLFLTKFFLFLTNIFIFSIFCKLTKKIFLRKISFWKFDVPIWIFGQHLNFCRINTSLAMRRLKRVFSIRTLFLWLHRIFNFIFYYKTEY